MLSALDAEGLCETDRGEPTIWKRKVVWPPRLILCYSLFRVPWSKCVEGTKHT